MYTVKRYSIPRRACANFCWTDTKHLLRFYGIDAIQHCDKTKKRQ